jgi:hypothetical protein
MSWDLYRFVVRNLRYAHASNGVVFQITLITMQVRSSRHIGTWPASASTSEDKRSKGLLVCQAQAPTQKDHCEDDLNFWCYVISTLSYILYTISRGKLTSRRTREEL